MEVVETTEYSVAWISALGSRLPEPNPLPEFEFEFKPRTHSQAKFKIPAQSIHNEFKFNLWTHITHSLFISPQLLC